MAVRVFSRTIQTGVCMRSVVGVRELRERVEPAGRPDAVDGFVLGVETET
jgi:hypothetical protein